MIACIAYPILHCSILKKGGYVHSVEVLTLYQSNEERVGNPPNMRYHSQDKLGPKHLKLAYAYSPKLGNLSRK